MTLRLSKSPLPRNPEMSLQARGFLCCFAVYSTRISLICTSFPFRRKVRSLLQKGQILPYFTVGKTVTFHICHFSERGDVGDIKYAVKMKALLFRASFPNADVFPTFPVAQMPEHCTQFLFERRFGMNGVVIRSVRLTVIKLGVRTNSLRFRQKQSRRRLASVLFFSEGIRTERK